MSRQPRHAVAAPAASPKVARGVGPPPGWDRLTWLVALALAVIVIAAFVPVLFNGFVTWDDDDNFLENPHFRGLGPAQVAWAWTTFKLGVYQPLAWILFEAEYVVWKLNPLGYHLTSLLLHAVNAVVLYVLTVTLLVRCRTDHCLEDPLVCSLAAGVAAALFAVHPLRVEVVAWASGQPYLPCALFSMLAVIAYLRAFSRGQSPRWGWLVVSFVLFVAALLSHAVAMSLPVVLLILDVYPLRRLGADPGRWLGPLARRTVWEKVPFVIVSLVFMALARAGKTPSLIRVENDHASARFAQACYGTWFYIRKTVLPLELNAFYPLPAEIDWRSPPFLLSILGTLAMSLGLFLLRRRWPGLLAAWLSYLVILAPNSGIIRVSDHIAADRYSYMSMLGLVILAAGCLCRLWQMSARPRLGAAAIMTLSALALVGLLPRTWAQCRTWRDSETLFTHALNHGAGASAQAHNNLGSVLYHQGKYEAATAHYTEALRLDPGCVNAHNNLGVLLYNQGKYEAATAHYALALRLDPEYADAHAGLGFLFDRQGKYEEAAAHYGEALRLDPDCVNAHNNLGILLSRQGKYEAAAAHYAEALRLDPGCVDAQRNLRTLLYNKAKVEAFTRHP